MYRLLPILALLVVALLPQLAPWTQVMLTLALAKGLAVLGIVVLLRAGQVSFGHALFFAVAAYAAAFMGKAFAGGELLSMLLLGVIAAMVIGLLVGLFVVRYRGIFFGMLNLAFSMIFFSVLEKFYHLTGGSDGLQVARPTVLGAALERDAFETLLFYGALALSVAVAWSVHRFLGSPLGQMMQAIKSNEIRLEYLGISARGTLLVGYVLSAALCGLGGVIMAVAQGIVTPEYAWWIRSGELVFIAILGGAQSVLGAFVGALVYEFVRTYAAAFAADVWQMVLGVFLLVVILYASGGLVGLYQRWLGGAAPRHRYLEGAGVTGAALLEARGLEIHFGGVVAASDVNIEIREGHNLAIIGPNGAGKTTFLNICTGYLKPHSGSVWFEGTDVTRCSPRAITRLGIARAFQIPQLFSEHSVIENLLIAAAAKARRWAPMTPLSALPERDEMMRLLELVGCGDVARQPVNALPEGQRKLVDIALALALKPRLLLLDEPTSGVASSEKFEVMDVLSRALDVAGVTCVFVEHDMGIVEKYADEVAVWSSGSVALRGSPAEILEHPDVVRDVIGETA